MRILQRFIFGEVCYTGSLDDRMRELITITVLAVNQTLPQLKSHVGACLHIGITPVEIREAIYQCAPFIGFPKTLNAIAAMNEVFTQQGIAPAAGKPGDCHRGNPPPGRLGHPGAHLRRRDPGPLHLAAQTV